MCAFQRGDNSDMVKLYPKKISPDSLDPFLSNSVQNSLGFCSIKGLPFFIRGDNSDIVKIYHIDSTQKSSSEKLTGLILTKLGTMHP